MLGRFPDLGFGRVAIGVTLATTIVASGLLLGMRIRRALSPPEVETTQNATPPPLVYVTPQEIFLSELPASSLPLERPIQLRFRQSQTSRSRLPVNVVSSEPFISVVPAEVKNSVQEFNVILSPQTPEGILTAYIDIAVELEERFRLRVPLRADIRGQLRMSPRWFYFGGVRHGERRVQRVLLSGYTETIRVSSPIIDDADQFSVSHESDGAVKLDFHADRGPNSNTLQGYLPIEFDDSEDHARVNSARIPILVTYAER